MIATNPLKEMLFPVDEGASRAERAYRSLQGEIVTLGFRPGQALKEAELRAFLGLGRTPIREALLRLSAEGLVVMHANQGTFVAETNYLDLGAIFEVRRPLDGLAARLSAERLSDAGRERLSRMRDAVCEELKHPSTIESVALDHQIHELIYELCGNDRLEQVLRVLLNLSFRLLLEAGERVPSPGFAVLTDAVKELLDAIAEGRADDAQALASSHAETAELILRRGF
jgi:DNA-binding GntR family transcriptional regulator